MYVKIINVNDTTSEISYHKKLFLIHGIEAAEREISKIDFVESLANNKNNDFKK